MEKGNEGVRPKTKKPTYSDELTTSEHQDYQIRFQKIEQLRRNIENTLKLGHRFISDVDSDNKDEGDEIDEKYNEMIDNNLVYYVEKLKEETEEMLKE